LNDLEAILEDETPIIKRRFRIAGSLPRSSPLTQKRGLFNNLTMISFPIKLKEEIILNVIPNKNWQKN
jgi:hypothetical protein